LSERRVARYREIVKALPRRIGELGALSVEGAYALQDE
jgi:hypothetical protein